MFDRIFAKEEVNTGRQREFDYLKGIFMLFIYLIHAFQATLSSEDAVARGIYMFATMSGAAIFIFVMGMGTVYSKNASPAAFAKSGVRMVVYQYLDNFAYVAALLLPYPFVAAGLTETGRENFGFLVGSYLQYTNIFFITGIIYLILALLKKLRVKTSGYVLIGAAVGAAAPFLCGIPVNVPVIGYLVKLMIGEADFVSFTPLYFLSYALFGAAFGKVMRHVRDKEVFYRTFLFPCLVIVIIWWGLTFRRYGVDGAEMYDALAHAYTHPDLWHVAASLAHIFLLAAVFFWLEEIHGKGGEYSEPKNPAARQILYYSRHISKYYALHVLVYCTALGMHGYENFESYQCWFLALVSMVVTETAVRGFNYYILYRKKCGVCRNDSVG